MNQQARSALIFAGGLFLLADRVLKFLSTNFFDQPALATRFFGWLPSGNRGIAFGLPLPNFIIIGLTIIFIIILALIAKKSIDLSARSGIFLMILGALSNLVDRCYYGHALDYFLIFTSIFNLADVMIIAGAFICVWSNLKSSGFSEMKTP